MTKNLVLLGALVWSGLAAAQTPDPFGEALRRLSEQMERSLQWNDSSLAQGHFFSFPADTAFFQFDTTFQDGSGSFFFHFSPGAGPGGSVSPADAFG